MKDAEKIEQEIFRKKTVNKFFGLPPSTGSTDIYYDYDGEVQKFFDAFNEFKSTDWSLYFLDKYYKTYFEVTSPAPHHFINVKQVKLYDARMQYGEGGSMLYVDDPELKKKSFIYSEGDGHSESGALYFYYIQLALNPSEAKYRFCTEKDHPGLVTPMMKAIWKAFGE